MILSSTAVFAGAPLVGVVLDETGARASMDLALFQREALAPWGNSPGIRFDDAAILEADGTVEGAKRQLEALYRDPAVDIVLALGALSSTAACGAGAPPKPTIAPLLFDPTLQGLEPAGDASGIRNLVYLASPNPFERDVTAIVDLFQPRRICVLLAETLYQAYPAATSKANEKTASLEIAIDFVSVGDDVQAALSAIPAETGAVYVSPLPQLDGAEFAILVEGLIDRKLPSFTLAGPVDVERGILATQTLGADPERLARTVGLYIFRLLHGERAEDLPVTFHQNTRLTLNMATARAIDYYPSWPLLADAVLLNRDAADGARSLTLDGAISEALEANLRLRSQGESVLAGEADIREARSNLLPKVDIAATGVNIDRDRAASSLGAQAERTLTASLTVQQLLYSEPARANVYIQRRIQEARESELESLRLDIVFQAATTYLNVLRARTLERIRETNFEQTRNHLDVARERQRIGASGPADVYRWEAQLATDRQAVIDAGVGRHTAEIALNQLMHRPLEERFDAADREMIRDKARDRAGGLDAYLNDQRSFALFRDFAVASGLKAAPELHQLDAALAGQGRALDSAERAFYTPSLTLQGSLETEVGAAGVGSAGGASLPVPQSNDTDWSIAVRLSLPLYAGGARAAARAGARHDLEALRLDREAIAERIEQRIRTAVLSARGALSGVDQARISAEAARKNFELVQDAYSRGVLDVLDLIDAQGAALRAELAEADATYDFLIDVREVERAVAKGSAYGSLQTDTDIFEQLEAFAATWTPSTPLR